MSNKQKKRLRYAQRVATLEAASAAAVAAAAVAGVSQGSSCAKPSVCLGVQDFRERDHGGQSGSR